MKISHWVPVVFFLAACGGTKTPDPQHVSAPPIISVPAVVDAGAGPVPSAASSAAK